MEVLKGVDIEINKGEVASIVGPSGSGKSTLLNLIGGLDQPDEGRVLLQGQDIAAMTGNAISDFRRDHIGFIFQAYNLIPVLSAHENIEYIMLLQGVPKPNRQARVLEMLGLVGLKGLGHRRPAELSGGQRQRVAIARALVTHPSILMADEPTGNLDEKTADRVYGLLLELNQELETSLLLVTHDKRLAARMDRQLELHMGSLRELE